MERINTPSRGIDVNGEGKDGFRNEDLARGIQATRLNAQWFNSVQEEIANVIEDAGIDLDGSQQNQLLGAINSKIQESVGSDSDGITSARSSALSNRPDFLRASGGQNTASVLASETSPLVIGDGGVTNLIQEQVEITGLPSSPSSGNTATLNFSDLTDITETTGEIGYVAEEGVPHGEIPLTRVGAAISARAGQLAAFKLSLGRASEYFIGKIGANKLTNVYRRYFRDNSGNPIAGIAGAISSVGISMVELIHVMRDLTNNQILALTSAQITESDAAPGSPSDGDLWFNTATGQWNKYSGANARFEQVALVRLGYLVMDANRCVASRSFDLQKVYSNSNNIELEILSNASFGLKNLRGSVSVYGASKKFLSTAIWGAGNLDTGGLVADTRYTAYVSDTGARILSSVDPQYDPDLRGWYHPHESWRAVGEFVTDSSGNFADAGNWFPWEKFALHGDVPLEDIFTLVGSSNASITINSLFATVATRLAAGAYQVALREGVLSTAPHLNGGASNNENLGFNNSSVTGFRTFKGAAGADGAQYITVRRQGVDLARAKLGNRLKG